MAAKIITTLALLAIVFGTIAKADRDETVVKQVGNFEIKASSSFGGSINDELQLSVVISFLVRSSESMQESDVSATCGGDSSRNHFAEAFEKTEERVTVPFVQRTFSRNYSSTYVDRHKVFEKEWKFRATKSGTYSIPVTVQLGSRQVAISGLSAAVKHYSDRFKPSSFGGSQPPVPQVEDGGVKNAFLALLKAQATSLRFTNSAGSANVVSRRVIPEGTQPEEAKGYRYQLAIGALGSDPERRGLMNVPCMIIEVGLDHKGQPKLYQQFASWGPGDHRFITLYAHPTFNGEDLETLDSTNDLSKISGFRESLSMPSLGGLLQGIGPYHQRFFAWETIAKSNNVDNFSKWLDGEEINSRLEDEISGEDAGRSFFNWENGRASLRYVDSPHPLTRKINLYEYPSSHVATWAPLVPVITEMINHGPQALAEFRTAHNEIKSRRNASISSLFTTNASQPMPSMPSPSRSAKNPNDASQSEKLSKQDEALLEKIANEMAEARGGVTPGYNQSTGVVDIKESLRTMLAKVKDEDYRNDGPSKLTVVALAGGGSMANIGMSGGLNVLEQLQSNGFSMVREIRRGNVLEAIDTPNIPDGTVIYPIRLFVELGMLGRQSTDMYYFLDPFGSWTSLEVK